MGNTAQCCTGQCDGNPTSFMFDMEANQPPQKQKVTKLQNINVEDQAYEETHFKGPSNIRSASVQHLPSFQAQHRNMPTSFMVMNDKSGMMGPGDGLAEVRSSSLAHSQKFPRNRSIANAHNVRSQRLENLDEGQEGMLRISERQAEDRAQSHIVERQTANRFGRGQNLLVQSIETHNGRGYVNPSPSRSDSSNNQQQFEIQEVPADQVRQVSANRDQASITAKN